jgi:hypothetical protein
MEPIRSNAGKPISWLRKSPKYAEIVEIVKMRGNNVESTILE